MIRSISYPQANYYKATTELNHTFTTFCHITFVAIHYFDGNIQFVGETEQEHRKTSFLRTVDVQYYF